MNNYNVIKGIFEQYALNHGYRLEVESNLHDISINKSDKAKVSYLYDDTHKNEVAIDLDKIAHDVYRLVKIPDSRLEEDSCASADCMLIDCKGEWFLIEFKDQDISKKSVRDSVTKKAYQNWHWILDILYEMKNSINSEFFDFENPINFAKEHVTYILVMNPDKNSFNMVRKMHESILAGEWYTVPYMKKLSKYIFKDAYVLTPDYFEKYFVKKFKF